MVKESKFSLRNKIEFFKKKWLKDNIAIMVLIGIVIIVVLIVGIMIKNFIMVSITPLLIFAAHLWRYNAMMAYVEHHIYDRKRN